MEEEKRVLISGTNNRYQIKKLKKNEVEVKKRKVSEKWGLTDDHLGDEKQETLIKELFVNLKDGIVDTSNASAIIKNELNKKISSYKQQDILRKLLNEEKFINLDTVIAKLYECNLECYYCKERMVILYELVREMKQWTVDRINNDLGHDRDNIVMACLDCNLKRRRKGSDAFLFTKQLNIIKSEENAF
jgi:hypothetical protein